MHVAFDGFITHAQRGTWESPHNTPASTSTSTSTSTLEQGVSVDVAALIDLVLEDLAVFHNKAFFGVSLCNSEAALAK